MTQRIGGTLLSLCVAFALAGCGQIPPPQAEHLTSVQITRPKNFFTESLKPLDVTITNVNSVTTLYTDIRELPSFPSETMSCPADLGIDYLIKFKSARRVVLAANADPTGCTEVRLSTGKALWGNQALWRELAKVLGLPRVSDLWSPSQGRG